MNQLTIKFPPFRYDLFTDQRKAYLSTHNPMLEAYAVIDYWKRREAGVRGWNGKINKQLK
jgi:hypothetical protein